MSIKAKLVVKLFANEVPVAESADEILWQEVLARMSMGTPPPAAPALSAPGALAPHKPTGLVHAGKDALTKFAAELDIERAKVIGACSPTDEAPHLHLDLHSWAAFKKNTPKKGVYAVSAAQLAGTLACLWFRHAGLGSPTQHQIQAILDTINLTDKNSSRAIKNCKWLQSRGRDGVVLNPAEIAKALRIARAYCLKQEPETGD